MRTTKRHINSVTFVIFAIATLTQTTRASNQIKISGGEDHTLVLAENKFVWACGNNYFYQLGIGETTMDQMTLVRVHGHNNVGYLEDINDITAGWMHSLALDINGSVWSWGRNLEGQLGDGSGEAHSTPVQVHGGEMETPYLQNITAISAGRSGRQSLALDADNFVYAWGYNKYGQCGNDVNDTNELTPVRVLRGEQPQDLTNPNSYLKHIIAISAGADQSMALEKDDPNDPNFNGCVYTWGVNVWGDEEYWIPDGPGLLGTGSTVAFEDTPVKVHGVNDVNFLEHIVAIAAGWDHCMALENDDPWYPSWLCPTYKGRVYTWGNNGLGFGGGPSSPSAGGRLGDDTTTSRSTPVLVLKGQQETSTSAYLEHIVAIAAGDGHSMALDTNGRVYAWGDNQYGQFGNGKNDPCTTPVKVVGPDINHNGTHEPNEGYLENIVAISAGHWHCIAVDADGTIWTWGKGAGGRLGLGTDANENIPQRIPVVRNITRVPIASYFRIQPAIDDADNGDILQASLGTYSEYVNFGSKSVTLRSTNPDNWNVVENTIISGSNHFGEVVTFNNNSGSVLNGFTLTNAGYGVYCKNNSSTNIVNCNIEDNVYGIYGGWCTITIADCNIANSTSGDGIYCEYSNLTISNCTIQNNDGNGIYDSYTPATTIKNNIIRGNGVNGIYCQEIGQGVEIEVKNNWIHSNGNNGIFIYNPDFYAPAIIRNNTIVNNTGYGINSLWPEDANISNCIAWYNNSGQLYSSNGTFEKVRYSCIQNGDTNNGNINIDPLFYDDPNDPNNFHLSSTSPCVDAGNPYADYSGETDIDGEDRVKDGDANGSEIVDMGADEFYWSPADFNKDEFVNFVDYAKFALSWQSRLGEPDYNDICDLEDNNSIDYADLAMFCEDWLWQAGWDKPAGFMMMGRSAGEAMAISSILPKVAYPSISAEQQIEKVSPLKIEEIIDRLEQIWLDPETQKLIDEDIWLKFIESLKEEL